MVTGEFAGSATYIYNVAADSWRQGLPFPTDAYAASAAKLGESFIVVGGSDRSLGTLDTIVRWA